MPAENGPGEIIEITPDTTFESADLQVQLRFVEREIEGRKLKILQQAWAITTYSSGPTGLRVVSGTISWRDVPLVTE